VCGRLYTVFDSKKLLKLEYSVYPKGSNVWYILFRFQEMLRYKILFTKFCCFERVSNPKKAFVLVSTDNLNPTQIYLGHLKHTIVY